MPQAQDAYLRGLAAAQTALDLAAANATIEHFRRAVTIDPDFAAAWAALAKAEIKRINFTPSLDRASAAAIPRTQAQRAIQLDASLAAGYAALGTVQFYYDWDFPAAERTFRNALALTPSDTPVQSVLCMLLATLGRTDESIKVAREAQQIEPRAPGGTIVLGSAFYYARQYDNAEAEMKRLLDISPSNAVAHFLLGRIHSARGRHDDAVAEMRRAVAIVRSPGYVVELARVLTAAGRASEAKPLLDELSQREAKGEGVQPGQSRVYCCGKRSAG